MAEVIKTATRDAYSKALVELGEKNKNFVVLDADLAEKTKTGACAPAFVFYIHIFARKVLIRALI